MHVIMVEDESVVARRLARCVESVLGASLQRLDIFGDLRSAEAHLQATMPDVLLLDLNLHGRDGFDLLKLAVSGSFDTIVVSATTDRAIEAFAYGVVDFVPKPFTEARLSQAFERRSAKRSQGEAIRYLVVRHAGKLERIKIDDIRAIHGANDYSELELAGGARRLHEKSLDKLAQVLVGRFVRIHRSHLVNLDEVHSLAAYAGSRYRLELKGGGELPVGRKWIEATRKALGGAES